MTLSVMRSLLLLFSLGLGIFSRAGEASSTSIRSDFQTCAKALPREALANGYHRFGDLDLSTFLGGIGQIQVRVVEQVAHHQSFGPFEGERDSAEWHRGKSGDVALNGPRWLTTMAAAKPMLALHEALGALRYSDDNFGCSGSLWILSNADVRATLRAEEIRHFETYAHRACRFASTSGGSTGVTGGGDEYNVRIRMRILQSGLREVRSATNPSEREAALNGIEGSFYQGYEINRHHRMFNPATFFNSVRVQCGRVDSIRVFYNGVQIPKDVRNGWTYDAASKSVILHGASIPPPPHGAVSIGPSVLCD